MGWPRNRLHSVWVLARQPRTSTTHRPRGNDRRESVALGFVWRDAEHRPVQRAHEATWWLGTSPVAPYWTGWKEGVMTLIHDAPVRAEDAIRETLPPAHVPSPLRNTAMLLVSVLVLMVGLFVALVLFDTEPAEIHDSWMSG